MARTRITNAKKTPSKEQKKQRLEKSFTEWTGEEIDVHYAYLAFRVNQEAKGNSKATLDFYDRFYKKFVKYLETYIKTTPKQIPVDMLLHDITQVTFVQSLGNVGIQTVNAYLRGYRAFGNFCEEKGYIDGFKCSINEIEPPAKQVYSNKELEKLMIKPKVEDFEEFRDYTVICLILATGARVNTLINLKIEDVDLEEGYITFNKLKAKRVIRLGLERKVRKTLTEYISTWRVSSDTLPSDYLFCNIYGEQLSRNGLYRAISNYNKKRGVNKTSMHLLRHTFAKNWLTSGGDMISLAQVLNHSELEMVKRYANLYATDVKSEIEQHSTLSQMRKKSGKTLSTLKRLEED